MEWAKNSLYFGYNYLKISYKQFIFIEIMKKIILCFILEIFGIIRFLLGLLILPVIAIFSATIRQRVRFELCNFKDRQEMNVKWCADILFEVSSEGELEQVRPLIDYFLNNQKRIELIYASASVEKKVKQYQKEYSTQMRIFRLPILTYSPWKTFFFFQSIEEIATAKKIIFCRYDFFPELILYALKNSAKFSVVSATLKNKYHYFSSSLSLKKFYYKNLYSLFDCIIAATKKDADFFRGITKNSSVCVYDFRVLQIVKRQNNFSLVFASHLFVAPLMRYCSDFLKEQRVIFGSAWPKEMEIFLNKDFVDEIALNKWHVLIAPHQLGREHVKTLLSAIEYNISKSGSLNSCPIYEFNREMTANEITEKFNLLKQRPGIVVSSFPGMLCELYTQYGHAFVGGGHGRSIHSLLEPYLGKACVYCGPRTHRSTEFDFILEHSPKYLFVINLLQDFFPILRENKLLSCDQDKRDALVLEAQESFNKIVSSSFL